MTDTGRIPEEGEPEHGFPFTVQADDVIEGEEEDLLMPGAHVAWGDAAPTPQPITPAAPRPAQLAPLFPAPRTADAPAAPQPGPTPSAAAPVPAPARAVPASGAAPASAPAPGVTSAPGAAAGVTPTPAPAPGVTPAPGAAPGPVPAGPGAGPAVPAEARPAPAPAPTPGPVPPPAAAAATGPAPAGAPETPGDQAGPDAQGPAEAPGAPETQGTPATAGGEAGPQGTDAPAGPAAVPPHGASAQPAPAPVAAPVPAAADPAVAAAAGQPAAGPAPAGAVPAPPAPGSGAPAAPVPAAGVTAAPVPQQAAPAVDAAQPAPGGPAGPPATTAAQGAVPAQPVAQAGDPAAAGPPRTAEEQATGAAVTAAATGADKAAQETTPAAEAGPAADVPAPPVADAAQGEAVPETTPAHPAVADGPSDAPAGPADGAAAATPEAAGDPQPAAATGEGPAPAPDAAAPADAPADAEPADTPVPAPAPPSSDGQDTPPVPGAAPANANAVPDSAGAAATGPAPDRTAAEAAASGGASAAPSTPAVPAEGADGAAPVAPDGAPAAAATASVPAEGADGAAPVPAPATPDGAPAAAPAEGADGAAPVPAPATPDGAPEAPGAASVPAPGADGAAPAPAPAASGEATPAAAPSTAGAVSITPAPAGAPSAAAVPPAAEAAAVHRLMREPRDVRDGFLPDPIPHEVLLRVLESAHTAPTSGHAQPWDFVIIRSAETRTQVHELAVRQHDAYAKSLPKGRAKQFKELKTDAILRTPVNIVVTADPTRGGRHATHPQQRPQLAPYSSALAVENLWLAARAEGLGVGWVSFYDERELVRTLDLPEHLEIVAYLCIGYVDAFAEETEPVPAGPARQRPLSWVVHDEAYGRRALPGAEPHDLLTETLEDIRPLDAQALAEAWERQKRMTKPAGALGALEVISAQLCGLSRRCPPPLPEPAAVAVFAGDHGVHAQGVTPWPQEVTGQMVANFLGGGAVCNAFAQQVGAEVCVIDVGVKGELPGQPGLMPRKVRAGTGDITAGPAMSREEALRAVEVGIETARDLVAAGNRALLTGEMGIANTTVAAALIAVFTGSEPAEVTGRGTGVDDDTHVRKIDVVRRALQRHQPDAADPIGVLAAVGGLEHAALTGFILGGASLRVPVILDGVSAGAAALTARAIAPEAVSVCVAGHRSAEPGHMAALTALGLRPLVDLDLRLGEGTGALLALPVVQSAARAMREVATFDAAGVSDKN